MYMASFRDMLQGVRGRIKEVDVRQLDGERRKGSRPVVLDVREPDEYIDAHIPGVVHVPLSELGQRLHDLPAERPLYVVCGTGGRSLMAATALQNQAGVESISVATSIRTKAQRKDSGSPRTIRMAMPAAATSPRAV